MGSGWEEWDTDPLPVVDTEPPLPMTRIHPRAIRLPGSPGPVQPSTADQWRLIGVCAVAVVLAFCCGNLWHLGTSSGDPRALPGVTTTVTARPLPAVTETTVMMDIPESCQAAMVYVQELETYANIIINASGPAMDALQAAYLAIAAKDLKAINAAQTKLQKLDNGLADPSAQYMQLLADTKSSVSDCLSQIPNG